MYFLSPCCLFFTEFRYVRLVGGTSHCTGKLEMKYQGEWRPVVQRGISWNQKTSAVVCKQLDCGSSVSVEMIHGSRHKDVWDIDYLCVGSESSLSECGKLKDTGSTVRVDVKCSGNSIT